MPSEIGEWTKVKNFGNRESLNRLSLPLLHSTSTMVMLGAVRPPRDCGLWLILLTIGRGLFLGVLINAGATQSSLSIPTGQCPEGTVSCPDFDASTTHCLPLDRVCDSVIDCSDSSDEADCDWHTCHPTKDFVCSNKKCITQHWVCDSANDCGDWSDEKDCPQEPRKHACEIGEFQCKDHSCIPADWMCDGAEDCPDKSDEDDCSSEQVKDECDQFLCRDKTDCIPSRWRCDDKRDCKDGSDEDNCGLGVVTDCSPKRGLFVCNDNCLEREKICDGIKHCFDGSDEGGLCDEDHCTDSLCSQNCFTLPTGPQCFCSYGYQLNQDNHTCSDVDECSTLGSCSQQCSNTHGSFSCSCNKGYKLDVNNRSCIAEGEDPLLLFSTKTEIRAYGLRSKVYFPVQSYLSNVVGVSYDAETELVYWSVGETGRERIFRSKLHESEDSAKEEIVSTGLKMPEDLQVDWIGRKLYFTDSLKKHIAVCELDGSVCSILTENIEKPRAIALDPTEGYMYWTDWGNSPCIGKAGMDGSQKTSLVDKNIIWPNGLTLDYTTRRLYWSDSKLNIIETVRLDGTDRRKVLEGMVKSPFSIAVFEDTLYWSDWKLKEIQSCNKFTGKDHQILIKEAGLIPMGIHIFHPVLWKEAYNPCQINICSHMCVIAPQGRSKCVCPVGKVIGKDERTCEEKFGNSLIAFSRGNQILELMLDMIGRNPLSHIPIRGVLSIGALVYDPISDSLIYSDLLKEEIGMYNFQDRRRTVIVSNHIKAVEGLAMDYIGNNIYWTDISKGTVEVMNVANRKKVVLLEDFQHPSGIVLIPEKGLLFVSDAGDQPQIARLNMDGTNVTTLINTLIAQPISLAYDSDLKRLFWCDFKRGTIESISIEGKHRRVFLMHLGSPTSMIIRGNKIYWAELHTSKLYSVNKNEGLRTRSFQIEASSKNTYLKLTSVDRDAKIASNHSCLQNNGGCSHVCLVTVNGQVCSCPAGTYLDDTSLGCSTLSECSDEEFECNDGTCYPLRWRCDGQDDCKDGEDERKDICNETVTCQPNYFTCADGMCIHSSWMCDQSEDCPDGSDEKDCMPITCSINEFRCADKKKCIPLQWHCDGSAECADRSDEEDCPPVKCHDMEFTCRNGDCIPQTWACDANDDCADGSDEENCHRSFLNTRGYVCKTDEFQCLDGGCVDSRLLCDGNDDCADKSDEVSCRSSRLEVYPCQVNQFRCTSQVDTCVPSSARCNGTRECIFGEDEDSCPCLKDQFTCENGNCAERSQECDGVDDCGDESDEWNCQRLPTSAAPSEKSCLASAGCWTCKTTPDGPRCQCQVGFSFKKGLCSDVDECTQEGMCSHYCNNTPGSYKCSCASGYGLEPNKRTCRALGEPPVLFYVDRNMIFSVWSSGRMKHVDIVTKQEMGIAGLDFDFKKKEIYYVSKLLGTVNKVYINNRVQTVLKGLDNPSQIAFDWITGNIYITEQYTAVIKVCNPTYSCKTLAVTKLTEKTLTGLALEPRLGYLFWCGFFVLNNYPHGIIMKMEMDGTHTAPLIKKDPSFKILEPSGIAVDFVLKQLFWADLKLKTIGRVNLDGTGKQIVIKKNDVQPFGLALFQDNLYFLAHSERYRRGLAYRCNKFSHSCFNFNNSLSAGSHDPVIMQQSRQPPGNNPCNHKKCSHLCVIRPGGYKCICPDEMEQWTSAKKCKPKNVTAMEDRMPEHSKSSEKGRNSDSTSTSKEKVKISGDGPSKVIRVQNSNQSPRTLVGVMVFLLFLALGIVTAVLYFKKFRKTKEGKAMRFHFHNPTFGLAAKEVGASSVSLNKDAEKQEVTELGLTRNSYSNPAFTEYSPVIQNNLASGSLETFSSPVTWPAPSLDCDSAFVSQSSLTTQDNSELMEQQLAQSYGYATHEKDYLIN